MRACQADLIFARSGAINNAESRESLIRVRIMGCRPRRDEGERERVLVGNYFLELFGLRQLVLRSVDNCLYTIMN